MSDPQVQVPLPPARDEQEERRGGGLVFWLGRVVRSVPFRVGLATAISMLVFLVARDFLLSREAIDPRLDSTRDELARAGDSGGAPAGESDTDDPFGLGDRPPPSLPPEASGLVGSVSTQGLQKGRHAWGGLRPSEREAARSGARLEREADYDENGDPVVPELAGREVGGDSANAGSAGSGGRGGEGPGTGEMNAKERATKSVMRGWAWKDGAGGTKAKIADSGALDKLKAMEGVMKAYGESNATSAGSAHKKMWEAASYTDWKLATQTSKGRSSVRDYRIGKKTKPKPIVDEGEGGPLAAARAAGRERKTGGSGKTFSAAEAPEEELAPETGAAGGALVPLASALLLNSTGLNTSDLPSDIGAAETIGAANAGNLLGLSGVGMMATGQTVQGASLAGLGALLAAQGGGG
jgi:hypothetical protein